MSHTKNLLILIIIFCTPVLKSQKTIHTWETVELNFTSEEHYENPYKDVDIWIELKGPGFEKKVWGFWDGGNSYIVRLVATAPGNWTYVLKSNKSNDKGFANKSGKMKAVPWTKQQIEENPTRRGFLKSTKNGRGLQYADGTPFFMIGDTWLGAATWRLPFRGTKPSKDYIPGPGIGFEEAVQFRKKQKFNSVSMISCFPTWEQDGLPSTFADSNGIFVRNAWEKWHHPSNNGKNMSKNMRDEYGNKPFEMNKNFSYQADFDRIIPAYFASLDKKMAYLNQQGFVSLLESVRRDICPTWKAYSKDFNESYSRFLQYLVARYGAYNFVFSPIHLDWIPKEYSLTANEFNEALTYHLKKYGPMPFGQTVSVLINDSTHRQFGHGDDCPWLTMHSVGNKPRDHRIAAMIDTIFNLEPPYPCINFEPYYTGWKSNHNRPAGELPERNSMRDNYFARAQMYGSVLAGALAGHVHGTAAYDITSLGEPEGDNPHFWEAIKYESGFQMRHLYKFMMSEGDDYLDLRPAHQDLFPNKSIDSKPDGLDGWSYMLRNNDQSLALLYFEYKAEQTIINGFKPNTNYQIYWMNPTNGIWLPAKIIKSDNKGSLGKILFPKEAGYGDWALKIKGK
jgi:hypothetical protein